MNPRPFICQLEFKQLSNKWNWETEDYKFTPPSHKKKKQKKKNDTHHRPPTD
jgi:hypothetical protein